MIKRLRVKFIGVSMAVVLVVFAVMFVMLNLFMSDSSARETDRLLMMIASADGMGMRIIVDRNGGTSQRIAPPDGDLGYYFPGNELSGNDIIPKTDVGGESAGGTRPNAFYRQTLGGGKFFYGKLDRDGNIIEMNLDMMFEITEDEARQYIESAANGKQTGTIDSLRYKREVKDYGSIIVFAETMQTAGMLNRLLNTSVWVALGSFLVLFALSIPLSKWVSSPVEQAFVKQRRFISDAGHELKTPLTILSANADVLEGEIGENAWLGRIKEQTARMGFLINDLLTLAQTDESGLIMSEFDWSKEVLGAALEFESRAFEEGKKLTTDVQEGITRVGDRQRIRQLVGILLDNALKYSSGEVSVSLKEDAGKIKLSVYNTGMGIEEDEKDKIFERFYRSDTSRSRDTGGYGLGLAIAKSVVEAHKGSIGVEGVYGEWVRFMVEV